MTEMSTMEMEFKWLGFTKSGWEARLREQLVALRTSVRSDIAAQDAAHIGFMQNIVGCEENYNTAIFNATELSQKFEVSMRDVMVLLKEPSYAELELAKQFLDAVKATDVEMQQAIVEGEEKHFFPSQRMGLSLMTFLNPL